MATSQDDSNKTKTVALQKTNSWSTSGIYKCTLCPLSPVSSRTVRSMGSRARRDQGASPQWEHERQAWCSLYSTADGDWDPFSSGLNRGEACIQANRKDVMRLCPCRTISGSHYWIGILLSHLKEHGDESFTCFVSRAERESLVQRCSAERLSKMCCVLCFHAKCSHPWTAWSCYNLS